MISLQYIPCLLGLCFDTQEYILIFRPFLWFFFPFGLELVGCENVLSNVAQSFQADMLVRCIY